MAPQKIGVQKNYKFSKDIEKTLIRIQGVAQKRYNFARGAANHTFFLTHPVYMYICLLCWPNDWTKLAGNFLKENPWALQIKLRFSTMRGFTWALQVVCNNIILS